MPSDGMRLIHSAFFEFQWLLLSLLLAICRMMVWKPAPAALLRRW
jgi:hypothetical protein